jgi:hypothetical protein
MGLSVILQHRHGSRVTAKVDAHFSPDILKLKKDRGR